MRSQKFFICKHCGNLVGIVSDTGVPLVCCDDEMTEMIPNTVEASREKHLPVVTVSGNEVTVTVGSVDHPMEDKHYIAFVYLETKNGGQRKILLPGAKPVARFLLADDDAVAAFAYCNLHGLWKTDI